MTSARNARTRVHLALAGILTAQALSSCGGTTADAPRGASSNEPYAGTRTPSAVAAAQKAGTPVDPALVVADNEFGLHLLKNLMPSSGANNLAVSPLSVAMALQILYNGAAGATEQGMATALDLNGLSPAALNNDNAALMAVLAAADPTVEISVANSLWLHLAATPVAASFVNVDETYYGATIGDLAGAPDNVNAWVSTETNGLIQQMLGPGDFGNVIALLANTIYFKGAWSAPFNPAQTAAAPFSLGDGSSVSVPMMSQTAASLAYGEGTEAGTRYQAVRLLYGSGRFSMLLVLPDASTPIASFVAALSSDALATLAAGLAPASVQVSMPRFKATYQASLVPALSALGMSAAFAAAADFSAFPGGRLSEVSHATVVDVDEGGTVAAGATVVVVTTVAIAAPQATMTLNHPFFYAIEDDTTGELLFAGVLQNPNG